MKKFLTVLLTLFLFCLPACSKYTEKYSAFMMVRSNVGEQFSASFEKLNGTLVGKIKPSTTRDGDFSCKATLTEGEMNVYYDWVGNKELLFSIKAGESVDANLGYYSNGGKIYIIVETIGTCKGNFDIRV